MLFKEAELLSFNSVLDGKRIFGTYFRVPEEVSEEYIENSLKQLSEHQFLDDNKRPNENFYLAVKVLKEYKDSERYLIMNQMTIAFSKDRKSIICLGKTDNGYEMTAMRKELFLYEYMKSIPFLAEEDTKERISDKVELKDWNKELEDPALKNITFIQEFNQNKFGNTYILYQKGSRGYLYEPAVEMMRQGGSLQFRKLLMNLFQMNREELYRGLKH